MKKSTYVAIFLGAISGMLFAFGMCMVMLEEWNLFQTGCIVGCAGLLLACITILIWRRMEHKAPIHLTRKTIGIILLSICGILSFGSGMSLIMIWKQMVAGSIVGVIGLCLLLGLLPIIKGVKP